jgi:diguanylate cyclase (GGDEF)-like protein
VSFRNRLTLFFVLIVIVPMLAVAFLLFRLIDESEKGKFESAIFQQQRAAKALFEDQINLAGEALENQVGRDEAFSTAVQNGDLKRAAERAKALTESRGVQRILFVRDGKIMLSAGTRYAIAPAIRDIKSAGGDELGRLEVSITDARTYVVRARRITGLNTVVLNGSRVLASTLPAAKGRALPTAEGATATIDGTEYRVQQFTASRSFAGQKIRVLTLGSRGAALSGDASSDSGNKTFAGVILLGFLLLAIACAILVSRTLQREIAGFLTAARKLAAGDFSAQVPTVGRDEFAALGEEFNKMSGELERRLAELSQERGRVQDSMRRLGEAVGSNLDRDALLALVVRTAVDGLAADAGRACVRMGGYGQLEERSRVGNMHGLEDALHTVEQDALHNGATRETTVGEITAIAHPLRGANGSDEIVGVVSVARAGRPFTPGDRELFSYLAGQVARSMENVSLHETTARQSVTDELTGLANRRAFDDALASEIERNKRFGTDLGLVLIDLDNFKAVNDTYGHQQGDVVLREVARVLRDGSREIDFPARYGGEELAVILPGTDLEGAFHRAERIREQIEQVRIGRLDGGGALTVTASCGVAATRSTGADGRLLVQAADGALYEAKRAGKNMSVRAR